MRSLLLSLVVVVLSSCSAQWHVKRAVLKDPSILTPQESINIDTVIVTKEKTLTDTLILNDVDSVIVTQDRVVTKIWRQYDTLRVETTCPPDTVRIVIEKECPPQVKYTPQTFWQKFGKSVLWIAIIVVALLLVRWIVLRLF